MQCPGQCKTCPRTRNREWYCNIRAKEWLKSIDTIMSKTRSQGEGQAMAEEIIKYMENEFMGGL